MWSGSFLEEKDIPGASLCGRKPSELKNVELNFGWDVEVIRTKASKPKPNLWRGMISIAAIIVILQITLKIFSRLIFIRFLYQGRRVHQDRERQKYRGSWSKWSLHQAKTTMQRIGIGAASSVTDGDAHNKERLTVKYPTDGWSTSLEKMPMFTRREMPTWSEKLYSHFRQNNLSLCIEAHSSS